MKLQQWAKCCNGNHKSGANESLMFTQTLRADGIYIRPTSVELEPKCVPQLFLGSPLGTRRSAVGQKLKSELHDDVF